jgi:hypothetical protein
LLIDTWAVVTEEEEDEEEEADDDDDDDDYYINNVGSSEYEFCTEFFKTPPII